jgi:hypothetical protein
MKGGLPGIAQDVTILTTLQWHAHHSVDGGSDLADRVHLLVDDISRHVPALKEIAVESPEFAIDLLFL